MMKGQQVIDEIRNFDNRHSALKAFFNQFQVNLLHLGNANFPVRGFSVSNLDSLRSTIAYIDREYEIRFSTRMNDAALVGVITVSRVIDRAQKQFIEQSSVTYNGQSVVSLPPPQGEDPIRLNVDNDCIALVLNWVRDDVCA